MSKKLGYEPAPAGPGKDSYQAKGEGQFHQKPKARQDGVNSKKGGEQAGDCLSNNNGTVNRDY